MAIHIEAQYSKKLGLPGFSSHQYSITIRTELSDVSQVERESIQLYARLQRSVDREIQATGFIPELNGVPKVNSAPNGSGSDIWSCSEKQQALILKIVEEHGLEKQEIEALAKERFKVSIKALNRLQASSLIEELIARYPSKRNGPHRILRGSGRIVR